MSVPLNDVSTIDRSVLLRNCSVRHHRTNVSQIIYQPVSNHSLRRLMSLSVLSITFAALCLIDRIDVALAHKKICRLSLDINSIFYRWISFNTAVSIQLILNFCFAHFVFHVSHASSHILNLKQFSNLQMESNPMWLVSTVLGRQVSSGFLAEQTIIIIYNRNQSFTHIETALNSTRNVCAMSDNYLGCGKSI